MVIAHNMMAFNAQRQFNIVGNNKKNSVEKLSSGYKINRAADDAAGLAISEKMRKQIRGLSQGIDNTQDGISFIQIGDGALEEVSEMLNRITQLSVKAANGTLSSEDRQAVDDEVQQLKSQINQIGNKTLFNELKVFSDEHASLSVDGSPNDVNFFDSSYDASTGKVEYGGMFVMGERISWDTINPDMVYIDAETNEQKFHEGTYTFKALNGMQFRLDCNEGDKTPIMTRKIDISADEKGIYFDNYRVDWSELRDEYGKSASSTNAHDGVWSIDYFGAKININIFNGSTSIKGMASAINDLKSQKASYKLESGYLKDIPEQAVDTSFDLGIQITTYELATKLRGSDNPYNNLRAGCDVNGIWLENWNSTEKKYEEIPNSLKTWEDMGINNWNDGTDISSGKKYTYSFDNGDAKFGFDYFLSNYTSVDSIIMGLNEMKIKSDSIVVKNSSTATTSNPKAEILSVGSNVKLTFIGEYDSGRDFTQKNTIINEQNIKSDAGGTNMATLSYNGNQILKGSVSADDTNMVSDLERYYKKIENIKTAKLIAGEPTDDITPPDLKYVLGSDKIDTDGYFSSTIMLSNDMVYTNGMKDYPVKIGTTYPAAYMDFSGLGTDYRYANLAGAGFDSVCMTCTNHYSVRFIYGGLDDEQYTPEGFGYSTEEFDRNYCLNIDLTTLKTDDGKEFDADNFTKAVIRTIEEAGQEFHFTQYAAKDGVLYAFDNRSSYVGVNAGEFYTKPYENDSTGEYKFTMNANAPYATGNMTIDYKYDFRDAASNVRVSAVEDPDGQYVEIINPEGKKTYFDKTPENMYDEHGNPVKLYSIKIDYSFKGVDGKKESAKAFANDAINDMLNKTSIKSESIDYAKINMEGNEKPNVCFLGDFGVLAKHEYDLDGVRIQHSSETDDHTDIPRFALNTVVLDLFSANTKTVDNALNCIDQVSTAQRYVSSHRATWGAYQNRLEHTLKANHNTMENTQSAESVIRDTDMAKEMLTYSKNNILEQAMQSILTQANQSKQGVLALLG